MPIFAYRCDSCGFEKDVLQKRSDPALSECPSCGQPSFNKRLTAPAFQLKGSGWYVTDFKGGSGGSAGTTTPKADTAAASSSSSDSGTSTAATPCGGSCACH